jgi:hypothetical protein
VQDNRVYMIHATARDMRNRQRPRPSGKIEGPVRVDSQYESSSVRTGLSRFWFASECATATYCSQMWFLFDRAGQSRIHDPCHEKQAAAKTERQNRGSREGRFSIRVIKRSYRLISAILRRASCRFWFASECATATYCSQMWFLFDRAGPSGKIEGPVRVDSQYESSSVRTGLSEKKDWL